MQLRPYSHVMAFIVPMRKPATTLLSDAFLPSVFNEKFLISEVLMTKVNHPCLKRHERRAFSRNTLMNKWIARLCCAPCVEK